MPNPSLKFDSALAGALLLAAQCAFGQTLERAYVLAEPLQYTEQGRFRGCGLNIKLLQESDAKTRDYVTVSVNFWLASPGAALIKTSFSQATVGTTPGLKPQTIETSWIRLKGADALIPKKTMTGEDNAILAIVELSPAIDLVTAILQGTEEIQVGFRQKALRYERVFYGVPRVEQDSRERVLACFDEFIQRLDGTRKK